jgi:SAM-dependent methyltransferase
MRTIELRTKLRLKTALGRLLKPYGKARFIQGLPPNARLLDLGCGNNAPLQTLLQRPDLAYVGLDVGDYNQAIPVSSVPAEYVVTSGEEFAGEIERRLDYYDAIVSAHNLEHCDDQTATLSAAFKALKVGGAIFFAFPTADSVRFPHRRGTLNYYDDDQHVREPPDFDSILATMRARGYEIEFSRSRYRPLSLAFLGLVLEPVSWLLGRNMPLGSTWALYGFESIIWARRKAATGATNPARSIGIIRTERKSDRKCLATTAQRGG